jgi:hypothetical protein
MHLTTALSSALLVALGVACRGGADPSERSEDDGSIDAGGDAAPHVCHWRLPDGGIWFSCPEPQCLHPDGETLVQLRAATVDAEVFQRGR